MHIGETHYVLPNAEAQGARIAEGLEELATCAIQTEINRLRARQMMQQVRMLREMAKHCKDDEHLASVLSQNCLLVAKSYNPLRKFSFPPAAQRAQRAQRDSAASVMTRDGEVTET